MINRAERSVDLLAQSHQTHSGVFITGPSTIAVLEDTLPDEYFSDAYVVTASLGNCRCASDGKAIKQFTSHARVPNDAAQVALGHETVQLVIKAPEHTGLQAGDLVFVTPGHSAVPVNPDNFEQDTENGILPSLGYSYRYLGGLRQFNAIPVKAIDYVKSQGFGNLFNHVQQTEHISLASLAHAEPYACCYGTNKHVFTFDERGDFVYGVPPRARLAYLGGTARMAMINVTIVAEAADADLPEVIYITGSKRKLDEMEDFVLIKQLRERGVKIELIDRSADDIIERLQAHGKPHVIWTNFASQDLYDQASAIIERGGNINNYAGASDPEIGFTMHVDAQHFDNFDDEVSSVLSTMHHTIGLNEFKRERGIKASASAVKFIGFQGQTERLIAYLKQLPVGARIVHDAEDVPPLSFENVRIIDSAERYNDVFIAGTGETAAQAYAEIEPLLARDAAVTFVDGDCDIFVRSRLSHYTTRHQICGANVPWYMTNTSEPHADDMALHAAKPTNFDWMVRGVVGLKHVLDMMQDVEEQAPFGSFFTFAELPDLPWVEVSAAAFRAAADASDHEPTQLALRAAAEQLAAHNDSWSADAERALYQGYGVPYPLDLATA